MKWNKITIETTTQAVDHISGLLAELEIEGIEIEDNVPLSEEDRQRMFIDILPELPEDDGTARVSCYLELDRSLEDTAARIGAGLEELRQYVDVGSGRITLGQTEDKDWINNWKEFFKPFRVDDTIVIKPTWETVSDAGEGDLVVEIDPGTAFGTGAHETTRLCIGNLKKYLRRGDVMLDVGCGSGILSIIGAKLGASCVVGTDIDGNAVETAKENLSINGINVHASAADGVIDRAEGTAELVCGNVISSDEFRRTLGCFCYHIVVANILADVIIPLSGVAAELMAPGAFFISSGIIDTKAEEVQEALNANGFEIVERTVMKDWVSFVAKRREKSPDNG